MADYEDGGGGMDDGMDMGDEPLDLEDAFAEVSASPHPVLLSAGGMLCSYRPPDVSATMPRCATAHSPARMASTTMAWMVMSASMCSRMGMQMHRWREEPAA